MGPDSKREIPVTNGNATSFEVSDLKPCTTYTFTIITKIGTGAGVTKSVSSTTPQGGEVLKLQGDINHQRDKPSLTVGLLMSIYLVEEL